MSVNKKLKKQLDDAREVARSPEVVFAELTEQIKKDYAHYCELLRSDETPMSDEEYVKKWIMARMPKDTKDKK